MAIFIPTNSDSNYYDTASGTGTNLAFFPISARGDSVATYHFDAHIAGPTDVDGDWTNEANLFDGSTATDASVISGGGILKATGTTAPLLGLPEIAGVSYRVHDGTTWLAEVLFDSPAGGWTSHAIKNLHIEADNDTTLTTFRIYDSDGGTLLLTSSVNRTLFSRVEIQVYGYGLHVIMVAGDDDVETFAPPSGFTEFLEVNDAGGDDASIAMFYRQWNYLTYNAGSTATVVRSAAEEAVGVMIFVTGSGYGIPYDLAYIAGHFASNQNTNAPDPPSITTVRDGAVVIAMTGNRSDAGHLETDAGGTAWDVTPPTGYTIESNSSVNSDRGSAAQGAPGRIEQGVGNGDAQLTWAHKLVATAGAEDPGAFGGFIGARDHKTAVFALRPRPVYEATAFRFRNGDTVGLNTDSDWKAAKNVDVDMAADTTFRLRARMKETDTASSNDDSAGMRLYYSLNGGVPTRVQEASTVVSFALSGQFASGNATTELLSGDGGTWNGGYGLEDDYGVVKTYDDQVTEWEFSMTIDSALVSVGDTIDFIPRYGQRRCETYTEVGRITVVASSSPQTVVTGTATEADTAGVHVATTPQTVILATATEADTAGVHAATVTQTVVLATATEVDSAGAHTAAGGNVTVVTASATEADTAGVHAANPGNITAILSSATEADTAGVHATAVGNVTAILATASEVDTAAVHATAAGNVTAITGTATEADTAAVHAATVADSVVVLGTATEVDSAGVHAANPGGVTAITATASAANTAGAHSVSTVATVIAGTATEADTAGVHSAAGGNVTVITGTATEADTAAVHGTSFSQVVVLASATETDTAGAHAVTAVITKVLATATEVDSAGAHSAAGGAVTVIAATATEADTAGAHTAHFPQSVIVGTASEVDSASSHGITITSDSAGNTLATLYPTSQIAAGGWTDEAAGTTDLHLVIDETGAGGTDYIRGALNAATTVGRFGLTDMPAGFVTMDSLDIEIRHSRGSVEAGEAADGNDDTELFAQIMKSDGTTALTNEMSIEIAAAGYAVKTETVTFTGVDTAAVLADWDGAELRLRNTFTKNAANDGHYVWIDIARLINGLYTGAGGATVITGTATEVDSAGAMSATSSSGVQTVILGSATEVDTAGAHTAINLDQTVILGSAAEVDSAGVHAAVAGNVTVVTGAASEVDSAGVHAASAGNVTAILATATEVDSAGVHATAVGNVTVVTGTAAEVDTAGVHNASIANSPQTVILGSATEVDTAGAHAANPGNATVVLASASETDTAGAHATAVGNVTVVLGSAAEVDTAGVNDASTPGGGQTAILGSASETDTAGVHGTSIANAPQTVVLGSAAEVDTAGVHGTSTGNVTVVLGTASETDTAGTHAAVPGNITVVLGAANETDTAGAHTVTGDSTVVLGTAFEVDTAGIHVGFTTQLAVLGTASETDTAGAHSAVLGVIGDDGLILLYEMLI